MTTPLTIASVERIRVHVPFTQRSRPWNNVLVGTWGHIELCKVTTNTGVIGWGETPLTYTWKLVDDAAVARVTGKALFDHLWDDSLGAGLQMALLDAAGKALGVPAHRLLGLPQVRQAMPLAWWSTKMPPEVLAAEAEEAASRGFRAHKFKARPWFDVDDQVAQASAATPDDYSFGIDWNSLLLSSAGARPVLERLDSNPRVHYFEGVVGRAQVVDQKDLRSRFTTPLVEHYDAALFPTWMIENALDGFVVDTGGISRFLHMGATCAAFNKEFWLQIVGTGITTSFALQLSAVLTHARWPSVTGFNVFESTLVMESMDPTLGLLAIPTAPGLGFTIDEEAVERYRVDDEFAVVLPRTVLVFRRPDGATRDYASINHLWQECLDDGTMGVQSPGTRLDIIEDDGTADFESRWVEAGARFSGTGVPWPALTFYPGLDT